MLNDHQNRVDCLFVFSPAGENSKNLFSYQIGSGYIISLLRANGYKAEQFIYSKPTSIQNCVKEILKNSPRIVGFTVYNSNFIASILIAEEIKNTSPETILIFGGPSATNYSEFILERYSFIDVCFRNESEETFLQFISLLSVNRFDLSGIDPEEIKGISYRRENKICVNPDGNILINNSRTPDFLDKYPSPYLSGVIPGSDAFNVGLLTARGCNQNCVYCNCAVLSKRRFSTHSVDRVISELDFISRFNKGKQVLTIFDDAFSLIPQRAKKICRAIIENRINIPLGCITRSDTADEELLDLMLEAGFVSVGFSLESANPGTLRIIGKVSKPEDNPADKMEKEAQFIERLGDISAYAKNIGIKHIFASIMVGLPGEKYTEARRTVETIERYTSIDSYTHNVLEIFKGTPLYENCQKYGYSIDLLDKNPIFSRTLFPDDGFRKVKATRKSTLYSNMREEDKNTLAILSLLSSKDNPENWFDNVVLLSDNVDGELVLWLRNVLSLNGTIIQIYSGEDAINNHLSRNLDTYTSHFSPSNNIRNYFLKREKNNLLLVSSQASMLNFTNDHDILKICDFDFFESNFQKPESDFIRVLCRESGSVDSLKAYDYFYELNKNDNLFDYLINTRPMPYFANLCRWTKDLSNCTKRKTLFINEKSELRFCWNGSVVGEVGQSYNEIIGNYKSVQEKILRKRNCYLCEVKENCSQCISPFPLTEEEFCTKQRSENLRHVGEVLMSMDLIKQYV